PNTRSDIWILPLADNQKPFPFLQTPFDEQNAQFSPNGRWIAYSSDESGNSEVYVTPFPGQGGRWQISTGGGSRPSWRRDGKEIYYLAPDDKLMAVSSSEKGAGLEVGPPQPLFTVRPKRWRWGRGYDVTADGKRFVVNTLLSQESGSPLTLVVNWNAGLRK
ncbi:MAG: TolB family protein, partial [Terriglobales bacterium]